MTENVLIVDKGCDQTIVNLNSFLIHTFTGVFFNVNGAMSSMKTADLELVDEAYTLVTLENKPKVIFKINQCLCDNDPHASEALLQPHQVQHYGVIIDDVSRKHLSVTGEPGTQCMKIDDHTLPFMFDGYKIYCVISKPSPTDLNGTYPIFEITSSRTYEPKDRRNSRRLQSTTLSLEQWPTLVFPHMKRPRLPWNAQHNILNS